MGISNRTAALMFVAFLGILISAADLTAQHVHGTAETKPEPEMSSALFAGLPMGRDGSGTSWLPDSSPLPAFHLAPGAWSVMIHGAAFPRFTSQDAGRAGRRGEAAFGAPSMLMIVAHREAGSAAEPPRDSRRGKLAFRAMVSLDPLTEGGNGYPLLFQSGETWQGRELVDRQHPHDFVGELAAAVSRPIGSSADLFLYLGYPGEPALGPPMYLHRPSAVSNPDAPLGHHWQDSTHIAFGVFTAGVRVGGVKIDGSIFTGREPDEDRYAFDRPRFDSWSGRLSWNPGPGWALQVSHGFLRGPEAAAPEVDIGRTTASVLHNIPLGHGGNVASALIWGRNRDSEERATSSVLLETNLTLGRQDIYARVEHVRKTGHDLGIEAFAHEAFWIDAVTLGTARDLSPFPEVGLHAGGQITLSAVPPRLRPEYGRFPLSVSVSLRISPGRRAHGGEMPMSANPPVNPDAPPIPRLRYIRPRP